MSEVNRIQEKLLAQPEGSYPVADWDLPIFDRFRVRLALIRWRLLRFPSARERSETARRLAERAVELGVHV